MTMRSNNSDKTTIERRAGGVAAQQPRDCIHEQWQARLQEVLGKFEGMPEEIERDRTPPHDPPNFD